MKPVRISFSVVLALLLAACSLVPAPVGQSQRPADLAVQTASAPQSAPAGMQGVNQKSVTFPDMVTKTALADPEPSEVDELSALLASFQAEEAADFSTASEKNKDDNQNDKGHDSHAAYVLEFKSKKAKGKRQIWVPETGEFKLILTAGPRFELLDNDARDGEARVQMPASTLKTWVHLDESRNGGTLEVSDELYYVKDTLSKERKKHKRHADARYNTWFKLGLRPLPVPSDWHSPDGQSFVLRFKAQQVQEFQLIWQKRRESAPFPPGVAEIGPEGGKIELPGVAELEIFAGAITQKTLVRLVQEKEAENIDPNTYPVAPPVRIEPMGLELAGIDKAKLKIKIDPFQFIEGYSPLSIDYFSKTNQSEYGWEGLARVIQPNEQDVVSFKPDDYFRIEYFSLIQVRARYASLKHFSISQSKIPPTPCDISEYTAQIKEFIVECHYKIPKKVRDILDYSAENAYLFFKKYQSQNIPIGETRVYNKDKTIRNLILINFDTPPFVDKEVEALTYGVIKVKNAFSIYLKPDIILEGENLPEKNIDRVSHEVFHLFQAQFNPSEFTNSFDSPESAWLMESSARLMGSKFFYDKFDLFLDLVKKNKNNVFYSGIPPYSATLDNSIKNYFSQSWYSPAKAITPNFEVGELNYSYLHIFSEIAAKYGVQKVVDICRDYLVPAKFGKHESVGTVLASGRDMYNELVFNAAMKNYGMGTESRSIVEQYEPQNDSYLYFTPAFARTTLKASTASMSPFAREIDNLSAKLWLLTGPVPQNNKTKKIQPLTIFLNQIKEVKKKGSSVLSEDKNYLSAGKKFLQHVKVFVLNNKYDFKKSKPEVLKGPFPFLPDKTQKNGSNQGTKKIPKPIIPQTASKYAITLDLPENPAQVLVMITNPIARATEQTEETVYDFELIPTWGTFAVGAIDLPKQTDKSGSRLKIDGYNCDPDDCRIVFQPRDGGQALELKADEVKTVAEEEGATKQEIIVTVPRVGEIDGSIRLASGDLYSNVLDEASNVCDMLTADYPSLYTSGTGFALLSQKPCPKATAKP